MITFQGLVHCRSLNDKSLTVFHNLDSGLKVLQAKDEYACFLKPDLPWGNAEINNENFVFI